jgi:hypothetical protein
MKILHYAVFYCSSNVRAYLFSQGIDPNTVYLNDFKFMEKIFFIIVSELALPFRPTFSDSNPASISTSSSSTALQSRK